MKKFEYKKVWRGSDRLSLIELNMLGDEGWELVSTYSSNGFDIVYIFKKEKYEQSN